MVCLEHAEAHFAGITCILSVGAPLTCDLPETITHHKTVDILDVEQADLLFILPECIEFLDKRLENEKAKALVHCVSGVSRSAAVVMAYLMHTMGVACPPAYKHLKMAHRPACPNEGFVKQLKLFGAMGSKMDDTNPDYRLHRLQHLAERRNEEPIAPVALAAGPDTATRPFDTLIRCRLCRHRLATEHNVLDHTQGKGEIAFTWRKRGGNSSKCSSLFVEPMNWIAEVVEGLSEGKVCCPNPKCNSRLGAFDWAGAQCSCGAWVTPAFQLHLSRIDVMHMNPLPLKQTAAASSQAPNADGVASSVQGQAATEAPPAVEPSSETTACGDGPNEKAQQDADN